MARSFKRKPGRSNTQGKKTVYLVFGPTAVGKSEVISFLAERRDISLISADSVQVFKGLDIASAKPSREEMSKYPHYLIDIRSPFENFNVSDFIKCADEAVDDCLSKGRIPVVSGGSAYYFKHFVYGLSDAPACDPEVRSEVERMLEDKGLDYLYSELERVDSVSAQRIGRNNTNRIKRALEVHMQSGRPLSSFRIPDIPRDKYDFKAFALFRDRDELVGRIRSRLDAMFDNGIIEEIDTLKRIGLTLENQSMNSIGYKEFFLYDDLNVIRQAIAMNTIHYSKRQMTFFRSLQSKRLPIKWIRLGSNRSYDRI